jgi:hypothetical protein
LLGGLDDSFFTIAGIGWKWMADAIVPLSGVALLVARV